MYNSNNFALSKDTIFGTKNHDNINSILNNIIIRENKYYQFVISLFLCKRSGGIKMTAIKDRFISREEISKLLWGMINDISTHSLSMWLKSKTDDEFVVVPREFCVLVVSFLERQVPQKEHLLFNSQNVLGQLEEIKRYL